MLTSLASRIASHPRRTLLAVLAFLVLAAGVGGSVFGTLGNSGAFVPDDAESVRAVDRIEAASGAQASPAVILIHRGEQPVRSAAGRERVAALTAELEREPGVARVASATSSGFDRRLISTDGRASYLAATLDRSADEDAVAERLISRYEGRPGLVLGGPLIAQTQLGEQISADLGAAETLALPLLIVLSLLFFRGGRAAVLPLATALTTVLGTFLVLRGIHEITPLSVFALNLVIGSGSVWPSTTRCSC
jgi:RND superfamily putative drug exporter